MAKLLEIAQIPEHRAALQAEVVGLIDSEVAGVKGLAGMAIRTGYKVVAGLKGGRMIPGAVNYLLNDFCRALEPFAEEREQSKRSMSQVFRGRERDVANALLAITDQKAQNASPLLQAPYRKLRGFGETQVAAAAPRLADILERSLAAAER